MTETLRNHGEQGSEAQKATKWDELKNVPMNDKNQSASHEDDKQQYETELVSPSDILNDVQKFIIKDGKVYSRETRQEETDEDTILRAKTSKFIFNEAKALRDEQSQMFGDRFTDKGPDYYVDKMMDRYGLKDENTEYAEGKLLKELVDTGTHRQGMSGDNLVDSKYGMFVGNKEDFGKALLRRRLKQHGLEMDDIQIGVDTSNLQKDGYSIVSIKVDTAPLAKFEDTSDNLNGFHHPAAEQLRKLEDELRKAQKDGDEETARGYRAAMKMVVERNRLEVSPEEWDGMNNAQRERFLRLKMKEEKILGDKDAFDFWNANLKNMKK